MDRQQTASPETMSRRRFLRLCTAAAGTVALGLLSGCSKPTPTPTPKPPAPSQPTQVAAPPTATPPPPTATPAPKKPVTLVYWCYPYWTGITGKEQGTQYTPYDYPNAKAKEFMALYPHVTVQVEPVDWTGGKEKVEVGILSGTLPDVMREDFAVIRKNATRDVLEPIDDFITAEDREDRLFLDVCMYKGKRYSWPIRANAGPFFVNRALFKERNALDLLPKNAERDWTWDEFLAAAKALTFDRDGDKKLDSYGFGMHFKDDPGGYHRTIFLWNFGARAFSEDGSQCVINSPEGVTGLQYLLDLQDRHNALMPGGLALDRGGMRQAFMQGRAAMYSDNGDLAEKVAAAVKDGTVKAESMDLWPMRAPHLPGKQPLMYSDQSGWVVFRKKDADKRAMAMEFCRFMTSKTNLRDEVAARVFPARKSAADVYAGDPYMSYLQSLIQFSASKDTGHPYYFDYRHLETFMFQAVLTHSKTPKAALDELAAGVNKVLKDAGWQ